MNDAIVVENLSKRFRRLHADRPGSFKEAVLRGFRNLRLEEDFWALRDVSFRVSPGKMIGIIGQNGAGKSTLLRLIGGVGRSSSGKISVNGRIGALLDLTTGFHPDLTGRENVFISGVICGLTRQEVSERMDEIVAFAELEKSIDNPIRTYSTGMQMRLGFSVAIHTDPEILLIDEVLAVGDLAFQQKCLGKIQSFKERGCTILLISHDPSQARQFCDEVIWLRSGQVVAKGNPEVIVGEYVAELASETRRRTPATMPALHSPDGTEVRVNENRFGSMEMEIRSVHLFDSKGMPAKEIASGEALSVAIEFKANQPIQHPIFSISISREDGFVCFDTNTAAQNLKLPVIDQSGQIVLHLERLDLAGGKYFVDAGIYEKDWVYGYDYHWHAYPLAICAPKSEGILRPPQLWELSDMSEKAEKVDGSLRPKFLEQLRTKL
jgi:lipopolysaccharide transport system ATP-binding protein